MEERVENVVSVSKAEMIRHLKQRLSITEEELRYVTEQLNASNEEYMAANEELMCSNEELQAANEELESSRVELQALNLELSSLNAELEEMVEDLNRAREEWERTFDSVPDLIAILDNRHRIVRLNRAMAERIGLNSAECTGNPCYRNMHGTEHPPDCCPHSLTMKDGSEHITEVHSECLGGDFLVSTTPLFNGRGRMTGSVHVARDITEQKRMENELRGSEQRLKRSQEIARLGSWELNLIENRLTWSDEAYRIFGLQPAEFEASYEAFLEAVHPDDRKAVDAAYNNSLETGLDSYEIEHRIVRKDTGEVRIVHEKCEHFRDDSGRIIRSGGMVHDITERKLSEQNIARQMEELERFNRVAVGRELRMVELKKEVNELLARLGEPPRYSLDFLEE